MRTIYSDKEAIQRILEILYWDSDAERWDSEKEWDPEILSMVAEFALKTKQAKEIFG